MPASIDTQTSDRLREFLAAPAYGANALHLRNAIWKAPLATQVIGGVANEIADTLLGNDAAGADGPAPRRLVVTWTANQAEVARIETGRGEAKSDMVRIVLQEARRLRVPISFSYQHEGLGTEIDQTGGLYYPRPLPDIGKLGAEVRLLDTADQFEATITRVDRPGLVGRKVFRRDDAVVTFQAAMDRERTRIEYQTRKNPTLIEFANADLLGIVHASRVPLAVTRTEAHLLPNLAEWHAHDYRGRELATWIYERMMQRLGM